MTRARRAAKAAALAKSALECSNASSALRQFNAAITQALLDEGDAYLCSDKNEIDEARAHLLVDSHGLDADGCPIYFLPGAECSKASQNVAGIITETGVKQIKVPSTWREVQNSPDRDKWLAPEHEALDALLALPGNILVSVNILRAQGIPFVPIVTQRRLKVNPDTMQEGPPVTYMALPTCIKDKRGDDDSKLCIQRINGRLGSDPV